MVIQLFYQNFLYGMDVSSAYFRGDLLHFRQQPVKAGFHHVLRHLIFHLRRRGSGTFGVDKGKCAVIAYSSHYIHGLLEVFLSLSREAYDDIRRQGNVRHCFADFAYKFQIFLFVITAVHNL